MKINITEFNPDLDIIYFKGNLVLSTIQNTKNVLQNYLSNNDKNVVLDLSDIDYADSSGLSVIVNFYKQLSSKNKKMTISGMSPKIKVLFKLMRLDEAFIVNNDIDYTHLNVKVFD